MTQERKEILEYCARYNRRVNSRYLACAVMIGAFFYWWFAI